MRVVLALGSGLLLLISGLSSQVHAAPLFTMSFDEATGTATPLEVIVVQATIDVAPGSDPVVFGMQPDGTFSAGGQDFRLSGFVSMGDFFPDYALNFGGPGETEYVGAFAGMTLMPGEGLSVTFVTLTPPPGGAMPGLYQLNSAAVRVILPDTTFVADFPSNNSFERTVPESRSAAPAILALLALAAPLVRNRRSTPGARFCPRW